MSVEIIGKMGLKKVLLHQNLVNKTQNDKFYHCASRSIKIVLALSKHLHRTNTRVEFREIPEVKSKNFSALVIEGLICPSPQRIEKYVHN